MRSVEAPRMSLSILVLAAALAGCASVREPMRAMREAVTPAASTTAASAPGSARADLPVGAAAQRSFDEAVRALRAGRSADAERGFRALVQSDPELGGPHANLGLVLRQGGKLAESAAALERAVQLSPRQPVYLNQLGITYRQQGQFQKARDAYERALALDPAYAAPLLNLGILNDLYLGDGPRALVLYDRYLALLPSGDAAVTKWVAELKNRKPAPITVSSRKEKQ